MKITAIIGSQRKGNTLKVVKRVEELLKERFNDMNFEYVMLMDADVKICAGCFNCLAKGIEFCPLKDDIPSIISKIKDSDGVIFATPVYVVNVTPNMKNFIDRLSSICHRPELFKPHAMVVSTVGGFGLKETLKYMKMIIPVWGMRSVTTLGLATPPVKDFPEKLKTKNEILTKKAVDQFSKNLKNTGVLKPTLGSVIQFEVQKAVFSQSREDLSADYDFYQLLSDKNYYVEASVPWYKTLIAKTFGSLVIRMM
ncbi:MAG TPA: NAD(P)H-dependent oxidoreductase [bacterium]|nr:NAD(P)H-dependent oxidoreductase [bacterium]